ncbi:MAG TPA: elongation factor G [Solirubrobacteraceae bacterium]|nr:elongation factor G [Solirubrobacteraceae bacterium]
MHKPADRIRNVALIGHRGSGKTSLHEALLFEAGATNRLGSVLDGTTVSDSEPDEQSRTMSISASLSSFEWDDRKINLLDTPGEPSFVADTLGVMRVCESAVFVINAVMGVEVSTRRLWARAEELDLARMVFVNMLDRERADFFRALESLKDAFGAHVVATEIPIGSEHDISGVIDLVDMKAYQYSNPPTPSRDNCTEIDIPEDMQALAEEYREKMMDEICEVSDALMERYLEGEDIAHDEIVATLKDGTNHGSLFPVTCGVATRNLATNRLLDAIVEDLPSPVKHGSLELPEITLEADEEAPLYAYVFKTRADPFAGRINLFRVYQGLMAHDTHVMNTRTHHKERIGQLLVFSGKESGHADEFGPGDIGAVAKLKESRAGDWLAERDEPISMPQVALPAPVMAFAMEAQGDEDKVFTSLRRLQEEDPTIDLHRDPQTGDQIIAGLSQMHVEVIVDRLKERFGAEVVLKPPRVPYQETIRKPAKAHGRHKKQSGGRGQFGDCHIEIAPREPGAGFEFINHIKGGVIPTSFIPAVEKGVVDAMQSGPIAGCPVKDVSVTVFDGSFHTVDSSEMAFKLAGSIAMREAMANAGPVLLEPIMLVTLTIPEDSVGDVIGDLNSRRGRPQGMEGVGGGLTEVKAEVPMSEMLSYAPDLRSLTGGQGDYTMDFERYEEVPAHLQQKVVDQANPEEAVA